MHQSPQAFVGRQYKPLFQQLQKLVYILAVFAVSPALGQTYPEIRIDTSLRPSEFYADDYEMNNGLGGLYWKLEADHKLRFGQTSDRPPNPGSKVIGKWSQSADTLIFTIDKRTSQDATINPVKERPNIIKFNRVVFTWSTETDSKTKNNDPITLTSFCTVLFNREVHIDELQNELVKTIKEKLKDDRNYDEPDLFVQRERIIRINQIVKEFLYQKKFFVATKTFSNGVLLDP